MNRLPDMIYSDPLTKYNHTISNSSIFCTDLDHLSASGEPHHSPLSLAIPVPRIHATHTPVTRTHDHSDHHHLYLWTQLSDGTLSPIPDHQSHGRISYQYPYSSTDHEYCGRSLSAIHTRTG